MLKRCPSCKASVLDDDAEVCPFCGSPMDPTKAKGYRPAAAPAAGAAAPKPTNAQAAKAPTAPAARPTGKPSPKPASADQEADPFAVNPAASSSAAPLSPKRTPSRPHPVKCPMCDTTGYATTAASGKEVRCANVKCLVPLFMAPDFAAPKPVEPEPVPSRLASPTLWTFVAVGTILLGAAAVWYFVLRKEAPPGGVAANPPAVPATDTPGDGPADGVPAVAPEEGGPAAVPSATPAEILDKTLAKLPEIALDTSQPQRKPFRRRMAAVAFALAGRPKEAREQLLRLAALADADPFDKIEPLVELAWLEAGRGDAAAAAATFGEAKPLADRIPQRGFDPGGVAIDWAAAAAKFGDADAGRAVVRDGTDDAASDQLLADLRAAALFHQFDLDAELADRPLRDRSKPKATAVVFALFRHGAPAEAAAWATAPDDPLVAADHLAAWAEATAVGDAPAADRVAAIRTRTEGAGPLLRLYVFSRAAVRLAAVDKPAAQPLLDAAAAAAAELPAAQPIGLLDMQELARRDLPDRATVRLRAAALGEAARAAERLGDDERAWQWLVEALNHLRGAGPSPPAIAERSHEFQSLGINGVRDRLKTLGNLSDDEARIAANDYRRRLRDAEAASTERFDLQAELLARAVGWGLGDRALAEAKRRQESADLAEREEYLTGAAGGKLMAAFLAAGDKATAEAIFAAGVTNNDVPAFGDVQAGAAGFLAQNDPAAAARALFAGRGNTLSRGERLTIALRLACRAVDAHDAATAFAFAKALPDESTREQALRHAAARAAASGKAAQAAEAADALTLVPTERAAVSLGLVEGLASAGPAGGTS